MDRRAIRHEARCIVDCLMESSHSENTFDNAHQFVPPVINPTNPIVPFSNHIPNQIVNDVTTNSNIAYCEIANTITSSSNHILPQLSNSNENVNYESSSESDNEINVHDILTLRERLAEWSTKYLISNIAMNELLYILHIEHSDLPKDVRTLKNTPQGIRTIPIGEGDYIHYGIKDCLTDFLSRNPYEKNEIILNFNVDGLPVAKSSRNQVWPILCNIVSTEEVMLIGVYGGNFKPHDSNLFLCTFVNEMRDILNEGIHFRNKFYSIKIGAFICDAPARAFVLKIKGHTAFFSCTKCIQKGNFIDNRITYRMENCPLRTGTSFRERLHPQHHHQLEPLALESLNIDCVQQFPLDYMHVVCLGIMKTLINLWLKIKKKNYSLTKTKIDTLNKKLLQLKSKMPIEFCRTPRDLNEVDRWKATEFRQFLLYTGPYILYNVLDQSRYCHFLKLSLAMRILLHKENCKFNNSCAQDLINSFIISFPELYSEKYLTYNFHCLIHLAAESIQYGSLENISAFKYENFLQQVKKYVKKGNYTVTQIYNRLVEKSVNCTNSKSESNVDNHVTFGKHISMSNSDNCYCSIRTKNFTLSLGITDSFYTVNGEIYKIKKISENGNTPVIFGCVLNNLQSFFENPIQSDKFHIFHSDSITTAENLQQHSIHQITKVAMLCNSTNSSYFFIPLLH